MKIDPGKINVYLHKWQDILRLRDWDINLEIVEGSWRKSGDVKIDTEDKKSCIDDK